MGFADLIRRSEVVNVGGQRYTCRPPTLVTLWTLFGLYAQEIDEVATLAKRAPIAPAAVETLTYSYLIVPPERAAKLLATCVDPAPTAEAADRCLVAVLRLTNVERLGRSIARDMRYAGRGEDGSLRLALGIARALRVDPFTVANDWPYEALLSIEEELREHGRDGRGIKASPAMPTVPGMAAVRRKKRPLVVN